MATFGPETLTDPNPIVIEVIEVTDVLCAGFNTGAIDVNVTGGVGMLSYEWFNSDNILVNTSEDLTGLIGGDYTLVVTDMTSGCSASSDEITVEGATVINLSDYTTMDVSASGDDGVIELNVTGGAGGYMYNWTGPNAYTGTGLSLIHI